jgi:hypothetical protein
MVVIYHVDNDQSIVISSIGVYVIHNVCSVQSNFMMLCERCYDFSCMKETLERCVSNLPRTKEEEERLSMPYSH